MSIEKRIFLVGCPRSGTTVVQSRVGSHPALHTFPETFFFTQGVGLFRMPLAWLGLATGRERAALEEIVGGDVAMRARLQQTPYRRFRDAVADYVAVLDERTEAARRRMWLEKTPEHLYFLPLIQRYIDDAVFIHLARRGEDVVASFASRARENPGRFGGETTDYAIKMWNRMLWLSNRYGGKPGHFFLTHEQFVADPERTLRRIAAFLGLPYDPLMAEGDPATLAAVTPGTRPWIQGAREAVAKPPSKFEQIFSPGEQHRIRASLRTERYEAFARLAACT